MLVSIDDCTKTIVLGQQHHHILSKKLYGPPADGCQVFPQFVSLNILHVILSKGAVVKQAIDVLALHSTGRYWQRSLLESDFIFFVESFVKFPRWFS